MGTTKKAQPLESETPTEKGWLTVKQMAFVQAIMADKEFNAERAAEVAGYKDYKQSAYVLMKNPHVQKVLGEYIHKRNNEFQVTAVRVLQELAQVAFFNIQDALDPETGELLPLHKMSRAAAAAVSSFKIHSEKVYKIIDDDGNDEGESKERLLELKFHNKLVALELLAKHVGILKEVAPQLNIYQLDWSAMQTVVGQRLPIAALPSLDPVEQKIKELEARALPAPPRV